MVPDESLKQAERKERQISIMLIAIVVVFLSCNILAFVVNILENVGYDNALYVSLVTYNNFLVSYLLLLFPFFPSAQNLINYEGTFRIFIGILAP